MKNSPRHVYHGKPAGPEQRQEIILARPQIGDKVALIRNYPFRAEILATITDIEPHGCGDYWYVATEDNRKQHTLGFSGRALTWDETKQRWFMWA